MKNTNKVWIGIDNGTSGTVTIIKNNNVTFYKTPIKSEQSYTKTVQNISRIDFNRLYESLKAFTTNEDTFCLIERPMVNPMRWKASLSAIRALEATIIILEQLKIAYQYIDSKEWQKVFLPKNLTEKKQKTSSSVLKKAAVDVARRLFPSIETTDADSLLIAEYARRQNY